MIGSGNSSHLIDNPLQTGKYWWGISVKRDVYQNHWKQSRSEKPFSAATAS